MRQETREIITGVCSLIAIGVLTLVSILGTVTLFVYSQTWYQIVVAALADIGVAALIIFFLVEKGNRI